MSLKKQLEQIAGAGNVLDDPALKKRYAADQSFVQRQPAGFIVRPHRVEEIQEIVRLANRTKTPLTAPVPGLTCTAPPFPCRAVLFLISPAWTALLKSMNRTGTRLLSRG